MLPLLGVIMTKDRLAMVSEWMANGNITQFVAVRQDENRFQLVSSLFKSLPSFVAVDDYATPEVGRCREGLNLYAWSENDPWGSQRGMSSRAWAIPFL